MVSLELAGLLSPISSDSPCGEALERLALYDDFSKLATSPQRPDWARFLERALTLSKASRDLRAWVWLARAALCAEGVSGLAAGLRLISDGLERYWDILPPQHADEEDPQERFMGRLSTLTLLGVTNFGCALDQLLTYGRTLTDLRADLDTMASNAVPDATTRQAIDEARKAISSINRLFVERFGADRDPQLGFDVILGNLESLDARFEAAGIWAVDVADGPVSAKDIVVGGRSPRRVGSRDDVIHVLDLVLDYYRSNEPSSPVPLLVQRAQRLVPLSFLDAVKDLAPAGLKELQAVAGSMEERQ